MGSVRKNQRKRCIFLADTNTVKQLEKKALTIREELIRLCNHVPIHIGGDMSVCDVMTVIWQYAMKYARRWSPATASSSPRVMRPPSLR